PLAGCCGIAASGLRQRAVKEIFWCFELRNTDPHHPLCSRRGLDGRSVVAGKEARLQLADPVPALDKRQIRIFRKTALDLSLIKLLIVEGAECRRQAAQRPDQSKLGGDVVTNKSEPCLLREREAEPGFSLRLGKRIA